jgi:MarR family transcriptional regulator, 2-MHQ and catechol-resistance regulon repressor
MEIELEKEPKRRMTQRDKTARAFRAFRALLDAADWIRGEVRAQLEAHGLTMRGFRVLDLLYRKGPMHLGAVAACCEITHQNLGRVVQGLEESGWVEGKWMALEPVDNRWNRYLHARGRTRELGKRIRLLRLTKLGKKFIGRTFPDHGKVIKCLMKVLDGREQESLERICRKLKKGDTLKYCKEMMFFDWDQITNTWPKE